MTERLYSRPCAVCSCQLDITLDMASEDITIRAHNLEPLARECLEIVSHYRKLKGLGSDWRAKHEARGIVYAGELIKAAGPLGGAQERVLGLLSWLKSSGKEFDLGSASSYFMAYSDHLANEARARRSRCLTCGESFFGQGDDCGRH